MTTYSLSELSNLLLSNEKPVTVELMRQLRDNPIAIAEQTTGAPINAALWHPYDSVLIGDGNDGVFWDHSVDGNTAALESPTLDDGYDYALRMTDLSVAGTTPPITIDLYLATSTSWLNLATTSAHGAPNTASGFLSVIGPRRTVRSWSGLWLEPFVNQAGSVLANDPEYTASATAQKVSKLRVYAGGDNFDNGSVALYRRRNLLGEY